MEKDIDFEAPVKKGERQTQGYVDLLVNLGKGAPKFLIEAKRATKKLGLKDRSQALDYGKSYNVPFVVVTNGQDIQCFNTSNGDLIKWDGRSTQKIPTRDQLKTVMSSLNKDKSQTSVPLGTDRSLPFRPGLSPKQLEALFYSCHSDIRKIEKSEERAFQDFSKILFLKLFEEKCDLEGKSPPYSYVFHELAARPTNEADQVRDAIKAMLKDLVNKCNYGDVLSEEITLKQPNTFQKIVKRLSMVSFNDSSFDSKGAAFEYYVRATLKGKRLGQYFTPRTVVHLMTVLVGREKVVNSVRDKEPLKVLDPACGTGGFLVFMMKQALAQVASLRATNKIAQTTFDNCEKTLKEDVFFGSDANPSVASAAKMNMIIAGDGHSNITREDSLSLEAVSWSISNPSCDIIITNPPFSTSEAGSLVSKDKTQFPIATTKGQHLFIQKMVQAAKPGAGDICTVIDEGVLNTESSAALRRWLIENCTLKVVLRLPDVTFKPNKISVRSSVMWFVRKKQVDIDSEDDYMVTFIDLKTLGYLGSGDPIRGFNESELMGNIEDFLHSQKSPDIYASSDWNAFKISIASILGDQTCRLDLKYWQPEVTRTIDKLIIANCSTLEALSVEDMRRGWSPSAENYVDEKDGYAQVVKAGSNINKFGEVVFGGDAVEKNLFEEMLPVSLRDGDLLVSSTGNGTLGKCAVYRGQKPAVADSHVTIIRLDLEECYPEYICDYLRFGFGATQVQRLFTGSTNLVELTPDHLKRVVIELPETLNAQKAASNEWRRIERQYRDAIATAEQMFAESSAKFLDFPQLGTFNIQNGEDQSDNPE